MALIPYLGTAPALGRGVFVAPGAMLIGRVELGEDASIFFNCVLRGDINRIVVGPRSNLQDNSTVHVSTPLPALIGAEVSVGHNCVIHACTVGDRVLVGMGSVLMDGVVVGEDCVIGAGSLLPKGRAYPAGSLILGRPAKVERALEAAEMAANRALALKYVGVKDGYLAAGVGAG